MRNKLDGLLQGNYLGLVPGPGQRGRGVAAVHTRATTCAGWTGRSPRARLVPHVRQTIADRELETWLVVDLSPSMDFGTALTEKRELVLAAITAVGASDRARRKPRRRDRRQPARAATGSRPDRRPAARPLPDPQDRRDAAGRARGGRGDLAAAARAAAPPAAPPRAGRGRVGLPRSGGRPRTAPPLGTSAARAGAAGTSCSAIEVARPARAGAARGRAGHLRRPGDRRAGRGADVLGRTSAPGMPLPRPSSGPGSRPRSGTPAPRTCSCAPTATGSPTSCASWSRASAGRLVGQRGALMTFLSPAWLLLLIPVGACRRRLPRRAAAPEEVRRAVQQRRAAGLRRAASARAGVGTSRSRC